MERWRAVTYRSPGNLDTAGRRGGAPTWSAPCAGSGGRSAAPGRSSTCTRSGGHKAVTDMLEQE